ncbi:MAG: V-type ATP synthase subunit C [Tepidanaerobacteraceae bacterium]|jgi:V/A-type H+-transporting ATPase subunit C|nr:V-type ATP synthase subunit C [Tepidanaerobacter sp.]HQA59738.1 V-type ATP synthase subunit C [Tepidanaerobacteraceae bacterium]HQE05998.1 V-type ATP synthase subunit C [Tepidanaerobacteraceae bacterium]
MAKDTDFLYVSARIKHLETKLLGRSDIERILDAPGPEEAVKVLSDTEYGSDLAEMENIYEFEKVLDKSMIRTIRTLKESFSNHEFIRFFTMKHDFHNLKVIVKAMISGTENGNLSHLAEIPPEEIKKYVQEETGADIPDELKAAYDRAVEAYELTKDPQQIDFALDQALFDNLEEIVKVSRDSFLQEYLTALSDLTNIKIMMRLKKMDADIRTLDNALVSGGSLSKEFFKEKYFESSQSLIDALDNTPYKQLVEEGISQWESTGSPSLFEKLIDNFLISLARRGLYKPFGSETVIGYLAARENEIKLLRIIMVGKINGISSDMIRERLRDVYV